MQKRKRQKVSNSVNRRAAVKGNARCKDKEASSSSAPSFEF